MIKRVKGAGSGGCCCGGCDSSPISGAAGITADIITSIKRKCCNCIPTNVCLNLISDNTGIPEQHFKVGKACDYTYDYSEGIVEYRSELWIDGRTETINIKYYVPDSGANSGECLIGFEIPSLSIEDTTLIDHSILYSGSDCNRGMVSSQCVDFGDSWDFAYNSVNYTLSLTKADTISLKDKVCCGGCNCICRCMCLSVWKVGENLTTVELSNELVCSSGLATTGVEYCDGSVFTDPCISYEWSHPSGYIITLDGGSPYAEFVDFGVCIGTGDASLCADTGIGGSGWTEADSVGGSIAYGDDGYQHVVSKLESQTANTCSPYDTLTEYDPDCQVFYEFNVDKHTYDSYVAASFNWLGRTHNINSTTKFYAYDYSTSRWDLLGEISTGRASGITIPIAQIFQLESIHTGTSGNKGKVKIKLEAYNAESIHTDMLKVVIANHCCKMMLTIPEDVGITRTTNDILPISLSPIGSHPCPDPKPVWTLSGTQYDPVQMLIVGASCAWCEGRCNNVITQCCNRQLPFYLAAEVTIGCPSCSSTCTVMLRSDNTSVWTMEESHVPCCGSVFIESLSIGCDGTGNSFTLNLTISGGCNYTGSANTTSCDPFHLEFSGTLGGGLGCCTEDPMLSPTFSVVVVE